MNRIFLITPGRSGTYWLSALMLAATNLPLTGNPEYFPYDRIASHDDREEKLDKIWDALPDQYLCTSLLPRMGYLDGLKKRGARFIHLRRDIRDNAYSMYRMHFTPGRGKRGKWYHPDPEETANILRFRAASNLTDYHLCLWACLETRAVAQRMREAGADIMDLDIYAVNDSNDHGLLKHLLDWIGVDYNSDRAKLIVGKKINSLKRYDTDLCPEINDVDRKKDEKEILERMEELQKITKEYVKEFSSDVENLSKEINL